MYSAWCWTQAGCLDVCVLHDNDNVYETQYDKVSKRKATQSDTDNFIVTPTYTCHMDSTWYTPGFGVVTIDT